MSLRLKILTILLTVVALFAAIGFVIQYRVIYPSYLKLERSEARKNMERCREAIQREIQYLDSFNMDWAAWDDTYQFIVDKNEAYITSSLDETTFINNSINLIHYYDAEGNLVWGKAMNLENQTEIVIPEFSQSALPKSHLWLNHKKVTDSIAGIVASKRGPLIFSSRPIITTANKGPIRGTLIMARFLNDTVVKKIISQTRVDFKVIYIPESPPNLQIETVLKKISDDQPVYISDISRKQSYAYTVLKDITGKPVLILRGVMARDISLVGAGTLWYAQISILCAALVMLVVLIFVLQHVIVNPILGLTRHAATIYKTNDLSMRLKLGRKDAIGELADNFDHMVEQLEIIHTDLEKRVAARTEELENANELLKTEISERRQVGKLLLSATKEIDEKNAQLVETNEQLNLSIQRANKLAQRAEAANEAKSLFLNNIGHEFRTPMNGIIGNASLLADSHLTEEQNKYLDSLINSSKKLLSLINDVLDFTNMESGRIELTSMDFNIRNVLDEVTEEFAAGAHRKKLGIACLIQHEVPLRVNGDPGRLKQILSNLVDNAVKFTERGEILILVGIETEINNRVTLRIAVTDTGIGIPQSRMDRLFDFFSQVDPSSTRKYEGTGIGLAISRHLAKHMGGDMGAESVEGQGATFWFTVQLNKAPCRDSDDSCFLSRNIAGLRVLIVDPVEINRQIIKEQLKLFDCEFDEVDDGEEALKKAQKALETDQPFDVALINQAASQKNGRDNGEDIGLIIKADPFLQDIALVLLANIGSRGDAGRLKTLGFDAYLTKPIKHGELCDCLKRIAQNTSGQSGKSVSEIITRHSITEAKRFEVVNQLSFFKNVDSLAIEIRKNYNSKGIDEWVKKIQTLIEEAESIQVNQIKEELERLCTDIGKEGNDKPDQEILDNLSRTLSEAMQANEQNSAKAGLKSNYSKELSIAPTQIIPILKRFADALELADPHKVNNQLDVLKEFIDSTTLEDLREKINDYEYQDAKQTVESLLSSIEA